MQCLISIIMPVFNVENYLEEALQSIELQSESMEFELIIVNDGSTDNSSLILEKFSKGYSRKYELTIINQVNKGLSEARNKGLEYAKGEYIYFFDSDDLITKDMLKIINSLLVNRPDLIKFNANQFIDNSITDSKKVKPIISKLFFNNVLIKKRLFLFISCFSFQSPVWLYVYKRNIIVENKISFKPRLIFEDELFNAIYFLHVSTFIYIKDRLFIRRIRPGSITTSVNIKRNIENKEIILDSLSKIYNDLKNGYEKKFIKSRIRAIKKSIDQEL